MPRKEDLTGNRYGRLTVVERLPKTDGHTSWYLCKCDCGNTKEVRGSCLKRGDTRSCGCLNKELSAERGKKQHTKHGWSGTRVYGIWCNIVDRCTNPNSKAYELYGGRGIEMCKEWRDNPASFCEWAVANGYKDNLTIDRINVDGDYEPNNCRWISMDEQQVNKRNNVKLTYKGKTQCVAEWIRELGLDKKRTYNRIHNGWTNVEEIFFSPGRKERRMLNG